MKAEEGGGVTGRTAKRLVSLHVAYIPVIGCGPGDSPDCGFRCSTSTLLRHFMAYWASTTLGPGAKPFGQQFASCRLATTVSGSVEAWFSTTACAAPAASFPWPDRTGRHPFRPSSREDRLSANAPL